MKDSLLKGLAICQDDLVTICNHGERTYPNECCGLLLGKLSDEVKIVEEVWPVDNAWSVDGAEHWPEQSGLTEKRRYAIPAEMILKAMKEARDRSLSIVGFYHSHPDCPAIPSEFDRACAWPEYSYVIISVQQGKVQDIRNWSLDCESNFQPEEILRAL